MFGLSFTPRTVMATVTFAGFIIVPLLTPLIGHAFYPEVAARVMIWAIAALSLNLILGYGNMVSFGHAVYMGVGAYAVGISAYYNVTSGLLQWPMAVAASALVALIFGAISIRTKGLYFIMITLALTQLLYFLGVSAEEYGADDGLVIETRSDFGSFTLEAPKWLADTAMFKGQSEVLIGLENGIVLYYLIFVIMLLSLYVIHRLVNSRFGQVLRATKSNQDRLEAIGVAPYRYKLTAFVIAGVMCGLAGVLIGNFGNFVHPNMAHWMRSGELIFMVVLGGMGSLIGPITGATAYLLLEEFLSQITEHWHIIFGPFLILMVLFAKKGIDGVFDPPELDPKGRVDSARHARLPIRFAASALDLLIVVGGIAAMYYVGALLYFVTELVAAALGAPIGGAAAPPPTLTTAFATFRAAVADYVVLTAVVAVIAYFSLLPSSAWQATAGKRIMGIHLVSVDGRRVVPRQAFQRWFMQLILFFSPILMLLRPARTSLHDRLAMTRVVIGRPGGRDG